MTEERQQAENGGQGDWVPLGAAFSHALAVEEAHLGVLRPVGRTIDSWVDGDAWLPTDEYMEKALVENVHVMVDGGSGKEKKKPGGRRMHDELSFLSRASAVKAHLKLISALRSGRLSVRARWTGNYLLEEGPSGQVEGDLRPVQKSFWKDGWMKGREMGPVPNYATGEIFRGVHHENIFFGVVGNAEVNLSGIAAAFGVLPQPQDLPVVDGGIFRYESGEWHVSCGGVSGRIPNRIGMGYLSLLLTYPEKMFPWGVLVNTGKEIYSGRNPTNALRIYLTSVDNHNDSSIREQDVKRQIAIIHRDIAIKKKIYLSSRGQTARILNEEISQLSKRIAQLNYERLMSSKDDEKFRQRLTHSLDEAFKYLVVACPPFIRHMGIYKPGERRALAVESQGVAYRPARAEGQELPAWDTAPLGGTQ